MISLMYNPFLSLSMPLKVEYMWKERRGDDWPVQVRNLSVQLIQLRNDCTNAGWEMVGKSKGWRCWRKDQQREHKSLVTLAEWNSLMMNYDLISSERSMSSQFKRGWKRPALQVLLIVCILVYITTWWKTTSSRDGGMLKAGSEWKGRQLQKSH